MGLGPSRPPLAGCPGPPPRPRPSAGPADAPSPVAPSTAQVRSGQPAANATSCSACAAGTRTRTSPSGSSAGPIAAAVCDPLCGSTPIITAAITGSFHRRERGEPWRACLIPDLGARSSYEPRHGEAPGRSAHRSKARPQRPAADMRASPPGTPQRYGPAHFHPGQIRNAYPEPNQADPVRQACKACNRT
jgi:hypothetical protein